MTLQCSDELLNKERQLLDLFPDNAQLASGGIDRKKQPLTDSRSQFTSG